MPKLLCPQKDDLERTAKIIQGEEGNPTIFARWTPCVAYDPKSKILSNTLKNERQSIAILSA